MTKALSRSERNIAAISMNSTTSAIAKLMPMLRTTSPRRSALPETRTSASAGRAWRRAGTTSRIDDVERFFERHRRAADRR